MINNPLIHCGLEQTDVFLAKTEKAVKNLKKIYNNKVYSEIINDIKLLKVQKKALIIKPVISLIFKISKPLFVNNLKSKRPSLLLFDFYKLGCFYEF